MQPKSRLQTSHSPFIQTRASKAFGTNVSQAIGLSSVKPALMCSLHENSLAGTQVMLSITCVPQLKFQTLFPSSDFQEEVHVMIRQFDWGERPCDYQTPTVPRVRPLESSSVSSSVHTVKASMFLVCPLLPYLGRSQLSLELYSDVSSSNLSQNKLGSSTFQAMRPVSPSGED